MKQVVYLQRQSSFPQGQQLAVQRFDGLYQQPCPSAPHLQDLPSGQALPQQIAHIALQLIQGQQQQLRVPASSRVTLRLHGGNAWSARARLEKERCRKAAAAAVNRSCKQRSLKMQAMYR